MLETLIYTLNDASNFGGCHAHLRDLWPLLDVFKLKNIKKYDSSNLIKSFAENLYIYF